MADKATKKEKSVGVVVFYSNETVPQYLLLHYPLTPKTKEEYWDLVKGHVEEGEEELHTARRELAEETGVQDVEFFEGFREQIHYFFQWEGDTVSKTVIFYLAEAKSDEVVISHEHDGYEWLPYPACIGKVKYQNAKNILKKAHDFLSAQSV